MHIKKLCFFLWCLLFCQNLLCDCCNSPCCTPCSVRYAPLTQCQLWPLWGRSFFLPRSQGLDAARDLPGTLRFLHQYDREGFYGTVSVTPQCMHSYKADRIAEYFFGQEVICVTGSQSINRTDDAILADYFGLSPLFDSCVNINPYTWNFVGDIGCYSQWNKWYATVHVPIVYTKWNFDMCENIRTCTLSPFPAQYMTNDELMPPINSFVTALHGGVTFGDVQQGICNGLVGCGLNKTGVADIHLNIGYDFWLSEIGNAGFYAHIVAPTGNRSQAHYIFEPIIGNGHHWELGLGFEGRGLMWECFDDQSLSFIFDGSVSHLFTSRQCRSFDFCKNCFGSRYNLLKIFDNDGNYTRRCIPAICVTTLPCDVHIDAQIELTVMLEYLARGFEFDVGYTGWIRSREILCLRGGIEPNRYGMKGIQNVTNNDGTPSNITQQCVTLHGNILTVENQLLLADDPSPIFVNTKDIDVRSGAAHRGFTHKLFIYLGYAWNTYDDCTLYEPFFGGGCSVEFEGLHPDYVQPMNNSMSQYSIWLKGGFGF